MRKKNTPPNRAVFCGSAPSPSPPLSAPPFAAWRVKWTTVNHSRNFADDLHPVLDRLLSVPNARLHGRVHRTGNPSRTSDSSLRKLSIGGIALDSPILPTG